MENEKKEGIDFIITSTSVGNFMWELPEDVKDFLVEVEKEGLEGAVLII